MISLYSSKACRAPVRSDCFWSSWALSFSTAAMETLSAEPLDKEAPWPVEKTRTWEDTDTNNEFTQRFSTLPTLTLWLHGLLKGLLQLCSDFSQNFFSFHHWLQRTQVTVLLSEAEVLCSVPSHLRMMFNLKDNRVFETQIGVSYFFNYLSETEVPKCCSLSL